MLASQATASAMLTTAGSRLNSGTIVLYDGAVPAGPNTTLSGNTVLATFDLTSSAGSTPAYNSGAGVMSMGLNVTSTSVPPANGGTATFARAINSAGTNVEEQFTVGTSGTDIVIGSTTIVVGTNVDWTSGALTLPCASN